MATKTPPNKNCQQWHPSTQQTTLRWAGRYCRFQPFHTKNVGLGSGKLLQATQNSQQTTYMVCFPDLSMICVSIWLDAPWHTYVCSGTHLTLLVHPFTKKSWMILLAGGFNPFEKYESNWMIFPSRDENKKYLSCHHLVLGPAFSFPFSINVFREVSNRSNTSIKNPTKKPSIKSHGGLQLQKHPKDFTHFLHFSNVRCSLSQ